MENINVLEALESGIAGHGNYVKVIDLIEYVESKEYLSYKTSSISSSYSLVRNGDNISNGTMHGIGISIFYNDIELLKLNSELKDYSRELLSYKIQGFESIKDIKSLIESILDLEHAKQAFELATQSLVGKNIEYQQALSEFKNSHSSVEVRYNPNKKVDLECE